MTTIEDHCVDVALRALRAGVDDLRNPDGAMQGRVIDLMAEVAKRHGRDGLHVLILALAFIGGALVSDLAKQADLNVDAYLDSAVLAEMTRQMRAAG